MVLPNILISMYYVIGGLTERNFIWSAAVTISVPSLAEEHWLQY